MTKFVLAYLATAICFLALDFVWLSQMTKTFYAERLYGLLRDTPHMGAAVIFYIIYVAGIVVFAVSPALRTDLAFHALVLGAFMGFLAYGTYDMTNYATIKNWSLTVTVVDMAWGTVVTGVSAWAGFLVARSLG